MVHQEKYKRLTKAIQDSFNFDNKTWPQFRAPSVGCNKSLDYEDKLTRQITEAANQKERIVTSGQNKLKLMSLFTTAVKFEA